MAASTAGHSLGLVNSRVSILFFLIDTRVQHNGQVAMYGFFPLYLHIVLHRWHLSGVKLLFDMYVYKQRRHLYLIEINSIRYKKKITLNDKEAYFIKYLYS